jgi:hypothetical protein
MTTPMLVRSTMFDVTGLAADATQNSFTFAAATTPAAAIAAVVDFFSGANGGGSPIATYIGNSRSRLLGGWVVEAVDITGHLDGKNLPSPVLITSETLPAGGNNEIPDQCAAVLAYHGVVTALPEHGGAATRPTDEEGQDEGAPATHSVSSRPRASLRGRLYIGPCDSLALDASNGNVAVQFISDLKTAAIRLAANVQAWGVWSRTYSTIVPAVGGWVNEEFGTQRRRKDKTVTRDIWP